MSDHAHVCQVRQCLSLDGLRNPGFLLCSRCSRFDPLGSALALEGAPLQPPLHPTHLVCISSAGGENFRDRVFALALTKDGCTLASAGSVAINLWNVGTGRDQRGWWVWQGGYRRVHIQSNRKLDMWVSRAKASHPVTQASTHPLRRSRLCLETLSTLLKCG